MLQEKSLARRVIVSHPQKERMDGNAVNDDNYQLLRETSGASSIEEKEEVPPYSFKYETYYFFSKGIPLMLSATLEWGVPPWAALAFAGHTHNSSQLQSALGYSRVFYNITTLMTLFSAITYFSTVIPGAIGAGRKDRVRKSKNQHKKWQPKHDDQTHDRKPNENEQVAVILV